MSFANRGKPVAEKMCEFDAATMRCVRCGYLAQGLPNYRVCRTLEEMARKYLSDVSANRISIPPLRIGDAVSAALSSVGVTKERVSQAIRKDCGCKQKQDTLNLIGMSITGAINSAANGVINAVLPNPFSDDDVAAVANSMASSPETNPGLVAPPPPSNPPPPVG